MTDRETLVARARDQRDLPPPSMRKAIRTAAGITLAEVAAGMDPPVSRAAVHNWENGNRRPRAAHLGQYAALLRDLDEVIR